MGGGRKGKDKGKGGGGGGGWPRADRPQVSDLPRVTEFFFSSFTEFSSTPATLVHRLPGCTEFSRGIFLDLPRFTGFYRVFEPPAELYRVIFLDSPGFTEFYRVLPGFTGFLSHLPSCTEFSRIIFLYLPGFTEFYRVLPGFSGAHHRRRCRTGEPVTEFSVEKKTNKIESIVECCHFISG